MVGGSYLRRPPSIARPDHLPRRRDISVVLSQAHATLPANPTGPPEIRASNKNNRRRAFLEGALSRFSTPATRAFLRLPGYLGRGKGRVLLTRQSLSCREAPRPNPGWQNLNYVDLDGPVRSTSQNRFFSVCPTGLQPFHSSCVINNW